jgi:hypothetical protein
VRCIVGEAKPRVHGQRCAAKASFSSIVRKSPIFRSQRAISFCVAGTGPIPITRGAHTGQCHAKHARARTKPCFFSADSRREDHAARAVIDAGRVARRHRAGSRKGVFSFARSSSVV